MAVLDAYVWVLFVPGFLPVLIRVGRGWTARSAPLKIAGDAIPALYLPTMLLAFLLPRSVVASTLLMAIAMPLLIWDVINDVRRARRSKAAAAPRDE